MHVLNVFYSNQVCLSSNFLGGILQGSGIFTDCICPNDITGWELIICKCNIRKNALTCIKFNVNTYTCVFGKDVDKQMDHNAVIVI